MNISMQLCLVLAACICLSESAPDGRLARKQRPTRGFKNLEMMTARGFGKRDRPHSRAAHLYETVPHKIFKPKNSMMVAYDFGKRSGNDNLDEVVDMDDFLETLASSPEKEPGAGEDKNVESMPLDLLVMEMMNNPEFTRSVVRKFIDVNQDGMLSLEELLRNVA